MSFSSLYTHTVSGQCCFVLIPRCVGDINKAFQFITIKACVFSRAALAQVVQASGVHSHEILSMCHPLMLASEQSSIKTLRTNECGLFSAAVQSSRSSSSVRNWNVIVKSFLRSVHIYPFFDFYLLGWRRSRIFYVCEWTCAISGQPVLNSIIDMKARQHLSWNTNWVQSKSVMCWWCGNTHSTCFISENCWEALGLTAVMYFDRKSNLSQSERDWGCGGYRSFVSRRTFRVLPGCLCLRSEGNMKAFRSSSCSDLNEDGRREKWFICERASPRPF